MFQELIDFLPPPQIFICITNIIIFYSNLVVLQIDSIWNESSQIFFSSINYFKTKTTTRVFDFRRLSKPANFGEIQQRVGYNLGYFSANYITIVLGLSIYALITNFYYYLLLFSFLGVFMVLIN